MDKTIYGELTDQQGKDIKLIAVTTGEPMAWLTCSQGLTPLLTIDHAKKLKGMLDNFIKSA